MHKDQMKSVAIIPARMGSSRFPGKPLRPILGMPMIGHVYFRAKMSELLSEVYIATCDHEIASYIDSIGGKYVMTKDTHERATERTAEALVKIEEREGRRFETVLMLQGDEPMVTPTMINLALNAMAADSTVQVVNLMAELKTLEEQLNPNEIKVVVDCNSDALYFSREPIPTPKRGPLARPAMKQVCVIPFRRDFLLEYVDWSPSPLEIAESVDMNRVLENCRKVRMVLSEDVSAAVDVPADIEKVERALRNDSLLCKYLKQ